MITFKNVTMQYPTGTVALKDVSLNINEGEFVFIVGSSGSGKSTILKLILKELDATSGTIFVAGKELKKLKHKEIPFFRRNIGFVYQNFRLLKDRTVYENVAFAQRVIEKTTRQVNKNVPEVLSLVGLTHKQKALPTELSGGEQQRVAIARAISKNPKLLLCDEPTGALDYKTGKQILKLLEETCHKENMTVIIVTHNTALADMADKVIKFKNGTVEEIYINPNPQPIETIEW